MSHIINADGKRLGRIASEAAHLLRGKASSSFTRNAIPTERVVIENASKLFITEKKQKEKPYQRYSGYPSGRKEETLQKLRARRGIGEVVRRAVYGMLAKNKLRARIIKNLTVKE
ncbi:MAG: 50S ribosomal protein L13 [Candidatus Taylorbacteria bacterium RIFCSPHIGHO2_02_FULL_47_18]|uniref:50S ribosomal protein L13 n=1 Tax=Candidatus Taylorbacteria bacterium RIFCSPLOWO2_01_FULL_48_100 TaxID=1802322 RepID=A0A1G2NF83_9BACT|nr:MAG: 50S ribosomal protein L13 [Candidatus Taylorbacteria bacterium RIFCSPHIGHO2_01_FULL_48_38]OHA28001.1 MAG: 50S ribosomal protein L13 [Candidatus Taylorbacteria bacterium RIFCSPHIGHO2_02_FULL_47_18]OHA34041.1 MAG: 50S ribosomal protein L13 [Candidatus Taylorbacteria bacterium RIFCSPLOWO2_01_FULL_48_100]OHA40071.1 MAG: 50S ribosomal protein L13 [Candidatus Taylorbacteria bacterium RIFCSPLOWO2_02_FULL_48_16]OHA45162.1 MAG: 50S ribosomal protein L13 [Candidatus Taylorbacteria bacterium RIFCS